MPTMAPTDTGAAAGGGAGDGVALLVTAMDFTEKPAVDGRPAAAAMATNACSKMAVSAAGEEPARTTTLVLSAAHAAALAADAGGVMVISHVTVTVAAGVVVAVTCSARRASSGAEATQATGTPRFAAVAADRFASTAGLPALAAASAGTTDDCVSV